MVQHILVAVDGSEHSMAAAAYAADIAAVTGARLTALFVKDTGLINAPFWRDFGAFALPTVRLDDELSAFFQTRGEAVLETLAGRFGGLTGRIVTGRPDREIAAAARDADLVALGAAGESHEETGDAEHLGARLSRLVQRINAPVLVAPARHGTLTRVRLAYHTLSGPAVAGAADLAAALRLPLEVVALGEDGRAGAGRAAGLLGEQGLGAVSPVAAPGDPAEGLRSSVREGDLVFLGGEDFDTLGDAVAGLGAPVVVGTYR